MGKPRVTHGQLFGHIYVTLFALVAAKNSTNTNAIVSFLPQQGLVHL